MSKINLNYYVSTFKNLIINYLEWLVQKKLKIKQLKPILKLQIFNWDQEKLMLKDIRKNLCLDLLMHHQVNKK